jgi:hypothetical protein
MFRRNKRAVRKMELAQAKLAAAIATLPKGK